MKKFIYLSALLFLAQISTPAINWVQVSTPLHRVAYIDVDSIVEYKSYYFYNIKFQNPRDVAYTILTVQSSKTSRFLQGLKHILKKNTKP